MIEASSRRRRTQDAGRRHSYACTCVIRLLQHHSFIHTYRLQREYVGTCTLQAACNMIMQGTNETLIYLEKNLADLKASSDIKTHIVSSNAQDIL